MGKNEPTIYQETIQSAELEKLLDAMRSEMDFNYTNKVRTSIEPLNGEKPIECEWFFKTKTNMEGM